MLDPTQRFSDRVAHYVRSRPSYPPELIEVLASEGMLAPSDVVADVGSGTGKLAERFLAHGNRVIGIEPNREMRDAGERLLRDHERFRSADGRAEATTLDDGSVDLVVCGQAFHWFDRPEAHREFRRILRPPCRTLLVWNHRRDDTPWAKAYEAFLLEFGTDYARVRDRYPDDEKVAAFFGPDGCTMRTLGNRQEHHLEELRSRVLSASYMPAEGDPGHAPMMKELDRLFADHQVGGRVALDCDTKMYFGPLAPDWNPQPR